MFETIIMNKYLFKLKYYILILKKVCIFLPSAL